MKNKTGNIGKTGMLLALPAITALCTAPLIRADNSTAPDASPANASSCVECCDRDALCEAISLVAKVDAAASAVYAWVMIRLHLYSPEEVPTLDRPMLFAASHQLREN